MDAGGSGHLGYLIKTFVATKTDVTFNRLPKVIQVAMEAIPDDDVVGFHVRIGDAPANDWADLLRPSP